MKRFELAKVLLCFSWLGLSTLGALADGGVVRLRQVQGPYIVTIFTTPEPVQNGFTDVSVMVQKRDSNDTILDATVDLILTPPAGSSDGSTEHLCGLSAGSIQGPDAPSVTIRATHEQASDKLLYAALIKFGSAGNWHLQALARRGSDAVEADCDIPVSSASPRLTGLLPYLAAPPLLVALFTINQCLRKQSLQKKT